MADIRTPICDIVLHHSMPHTKALHNQCSISLLCGTAVFIILNTCTLFTCLPSTHSPSHPPPQPSASHPSHPHSPLPPPLPSPPPPLPPPPPTSDPSLVSYYVHCRVSTTSSFLHHWNNRIWSTIAKPICLSFPSFPHPLMDLILLPLILLFFCRFFTHYLIYHVWLQFSLQTTLPFKVHRYRYYVTLCIHGILHFMHGILYCILNYIMFCIVFCDTMDQLLGIILYFMLAST